MECSLVACTGMSIEKSFAHAANREVTSILQANNPEAKRSKKRGLYLKYSAEQRIPKNKDLRLLYFGKYSTVMQTECRLSMLARSH